MSSIPFRKMNGLGNEFLVVDARRERVRPAPHVIAKLADRVSGVGFDQLITLGGDPLRRRTCSCGSTMLDGGEVEACGNGTRCVGWLVMQESGAAQASIETRAGVLNARPGGSGA
jgi:diaminopimelate epimerase